MEAKPQRKRFGERKPNIGTNINLNLNNQFKSIKPEVADKKLWLFISRVEESTQEADVLKYVASQGKIEEQNIKVKILNTKMENNKFKSLMVGVPTSLKEEIYSNDFWPAGIGTDKRKLHLLSVFYIRM